MALKQSDENADFQPTLNLLMDNIDYKRIQETFPDGLKLERNHFHQNRKQCQLDSWAIDFDV
jgi:hypothetical protein